MDLSVIVQNVASAAVGAVGGSSLVAYFIKTMFEHRLKEGLENLKHDLKVAENNQAVVFSKLHAEQAEVIKNIYSKLMYLESALRPMMYSKGEMKPARDNQIEFQNYYHLNKILLPEHLCDQIDNACKTTASIVSIELQKREEGIVPQAWHELMPQQTVQLEKCLKPLIKNLEKEFRTILGAAKKAEQVR